MIPVTFIRVINFDWKCINSLIQSHQIEIFLLKAKDAYRIVVEDLLNDGTNLRVVIIPDLLLHQNLVTKLSDKLVKVRQPFCDPQFAGPITISQTWNNVGESGWIYYNLIAQQNEDSVEILRSNEYLKLKLVGQLEGNHLLISERVPHKIISDGFELNLTKLEQFLLKNNKDVVACTIVEQPDSKLNFLPVIVIQPRPDTNLIEDDIAKQISTKLNRPFKGFVTFVDVLPAKIKKTHIRQLVANILL